MVSERILNEAIEHLQQLIAADKFGCMACRQEHEQLLDMLLELKEFRSKNDGKER